VKWDEDQIILVHSHSTLTLGGQQTDDLARNSLESEIRANWVLIREKLLADLGANNAGSTSGLDLGFSEFAAGFDGPSQ
jgi:hypothetical protein